MGLRSFFRRFSKEHIPSPKFARHAADTAVSIVTEPETARPFVHLLRKEGVEATDERIKREVAFLLHFSTYMALEPDYPRASEIFEQATEWLVVLLTRNDLWFPDRTEQLTRDFVTRQRLFHSLWENARRWPLLSTPLNLSGLCFQLARAPVYSLVDDPDQAPEAGEAHMEIAGYVEAFYERRRSFVTRVWVAYEEDEDLAATGPPTPRRRQPGSAP